MANSVWVGLGLGIGLAVIYAAASLFTHRLALRQSNQNQFLAIAFGGLLARMAFALLMVTVTLIFIPVHRTAFIGSFFGVFTITLIIEVLDLHRQTNDRKEEMVADGGDAPGEST
jgi:hypothetical protein